MKMKKLCALVLAGAMITAGGMLPVKEVKANYYSDNHPEYRGTKYRAGHGRAIARLL